MVVTVEIQIGLSFGLSYFNQKSEDQGHYFLIFTCSYLYSLFCDNPCVSFSLRIDLKVFLEQ